MSDRQPLRIYYSEKLGLKCIDFHDGTKVYEFQNGILKLYEDWEVEAFEETLKQMGGGRGYVKTVSMDSAKEIVEQHKRKMGPAAHQGGMHTGAHQVQMEEHRKQSLDASMRDINASTVAQTLAAGGKHVGEVQPGSDPALLGIESVVGSPMPANPKPRAPVTPVVPAPPAGAPTPVLGKTPFKLGM